jgi:hypothetical protein
MKQIKIVLFACVFLLACYHEPTVVRSLAPKFTTVFFASGTYAAFDKSPYCLIWDTVIVVKDRKQFNVYHIARHTAFQRYREDHLYNIEFDNSSWSGTYDPVKTIMYCPPESPDLSFDPLTATLTLGDHIFSKID